QLSRFKGKSLILAGEPQKKYDKIIGNCRIISHQNSVEIEQSMLTSDLIICRSGYSSIMDLATLKKSSLLIPTPGQTEQEYIGRYLKSKKLFFHADQKNFNVAETMRILKGQNGVETLNGKSKLASAVE